MTDHALITEILRREGWPRYTDRKADRGGPTKGGITIDTLSAWRNYRVTARAVFDLQEPEARAIYAARYITPWAWVPDERLRELLLDWAVTSWHDDPARALQRAVGAGVDGVVGPQTRRLTRDALARDAAAVRRAVLTARIVFYADLALEELPVRLLLGVNPTLQLHNLRGWLRRCGEFTG